MKHRLIHSSILVLLVSASASAEQVIRAQVPFPFHIGVSVMPSGSYTVDSCGGQPYCWLLRLYVGC